MNATHYNGSDERDTLTRLDDDEIVYKPCCFRREDDTHDERCTSDAARIERDRIAEDDARYGADRDAADGGAAVMPKRVDANHWGVFKAFKQLGWCVISTADLGGGFPDLVAAKRGVLRLIEVKDGAKPPSKRALTPHEAAYHRDMAAVGCPVLVIESEQQVIDLDRDLHGSLPKDETR